MGPWTNQIALALLAATVLSTVRPAIAGDGSPAAQRHAKDALDGGRGAAAARPVAPPLVDPTHRQRLEEITAARRAAAVGEDYVVGPDDLLQITVPDLVTEPPRSLQVADAGLVPIAPSPTYGQGFRVSGRGDITLPILGSMRASGSTPHELENVIGELLVARGILRRPEVQVSVAEYRSRVVSVSGEVRQPGLYPLTGPATTIGDMLWVAGGPTANAGRFIEFAPASTDRVDDGAAGDPIIIALDTVLARGSSALDPPARPGDLINVPPAGRVNIDGWVANPGAYDITRNLTVTGVIAAAGGPLFPAKLRAVEILRTFGTAEPQRIAVDVASVQRGETEDVWVQDGDVVRVPVSMARVVPYGVWKAALSLIRIGGSLVLF